MIWYILLVLAYLNVGVAVCLVCGSKVSPFVVTFWPGFLLGVWVQMLEDSGKLK